MIPEPFRRNFSRRELLLFLGGVAASGLLIPRRTIFLPPAGGWPIDSSEYSRQLLLEASLGAGPFKLYGFDTDFIVVDGKDWSLSTV